MVALSMSQRQFVCSHHDRKVETVFVECSSCGATKKERYSHRADDNEIARACFPSWKINGVRGAKRTQCPRCK